MTLEWFVCVLVHRHSVLALHLACSYSPPYCASLFVAALPLLGSISSEIGYDAFFTSPLPLAQQSLCVTLLSLGGRE